MWLNVFINWSYDSFVIVLPNTLFQSVEERIVLKFSTDASFMVRVDIFVYFGILDCKYRKVLTYVKFDWEIKPTDEPTISFIIFWDFPMFYQIFLSLQVKRWAIITYKHGIYELPHELPNNLWLRILGN